VAEDVRDLIRCEHFIYGLDPKKGIQLLKTPRVNHLLSDKTLSYLSHIGDGVTEVTYLQVWLPSENLLAVCRIHPVTDVYGRGGVWTHVILITVEDYVKLTQPNALFNPYFIKALPQERLKPIEIEDSP